MGRKRYCCAQAHQVLSVRPIQQHRLCAFWLLHGVLLKAEDLEEVARSPVLKVIPSASSYLDPPAGHEGLGGGSVKKEGLAGEIGGGRRN